MMKPLRFWIRIALGNLTMVALLGFLLRSKILFPLGALDYKNLLNAHSHFAFGGWITLALAALMVYKLSGSNAPRPVYGKALMALLLTAWGMALTFPFVGYTTISIIFSTAFVFATYALAVLLICDSLRAALHPAVKLLCIGAMAALVLSSAGPFALAWMRITGASNPLLYKDAIYTYLHLQYNGFFTLAVSALFLHEVLPFLSGKSQKQALAYARIATAAVLPALALSYLWHYDTPFTFVLASIGGLGMVIQAILAILLIRNLKGFFTEKDRLVQALLVLAFFSFLLKSFLNAGILYQPLGNEVFGNRPVIIGFLHLIFLGFVSLFLLAWFLRHRLLPRSGAVHAATWIFLAGVLLNELVLGIQGLGGLMAWSSSVFPWALWIAAITLFLGALLLFTGSMQHHRNTESIST